jgi:hypothetical protein
VVVAFSQASVQLASSTVSVIVETELSGGVSLHDISTSKHQIIATTIFFTSFSQKKPSRMSRMHGEVRISFVRKIPVTCKQIIFAFAV